MRFPRALTCLLAIFLVTAWSARAAQPALQITAVPKLDEDKRKVTGDTGQVAIGVMRGFYRIIVKNSSIMDAAPALTAKYRVFVLRDDGKKNLREVKPQRVEGESAMEAIKPGQSATFDTDAVKLNKTSLDPGYYYSNYQRQSTKDTLVGIWLRLYDGDKMVGEFISSSKLPQLGPF